LALEPNGCFAAVKGGRLIGTTTTTTYGNELAWIGMVLVDPKEQRQGIATRLLNVALDYLNGKAATVKLDATAQGQPVYQRLGFEVESVLERWSGTSNARNARSSKVWDEDGIHEVLALDHLAFATDRSKLLKKLIDDPCVPPVLLRATDGTLSGYALARRGTNADYVGPVVAKSSQDIQPLLDEVLSKLPERRVYIDLNTECSASTTLLADRGFVKERDLVRMVKGGPGSKTSPLVVAIAGPEIG
jgi:GNAT superfamily N-acetyltransferase